MYAMSIYYISTYHLNRVIKLYLFYINLLYHTVLPYARALGVRQSLVAEKQAIKTRKRCAQPYPTAREKRLERDNKKLREENNAYRRLERVVRATAAKGGIDYDALAQETATSESKATLSRENDGDGQDASDQDNLDGGDYTDEGNEDYYYDDEGYNDDQRGDENYGGRRDIDEDCDFW